MQEPRLPWPLAVLLNVSNCSLAISPPDVENKKLQELNLFLPSCRKALLIKRLQLTDAVGATTGESLCQKEVGEVDIAKLGFSTPLLRPVIMLFQNPQFHASPWSGL